MRQIFFTAILLMLNILFAACDKIHEKCVPEGNVNFYLIASFDTIENSCQIDESTVITADTPIIEYADLLSYTPREYVFKITDKAKEIVANLPHSVFGLGFAVKANNTLIYTGYFWPSYSSLACSWVVADPLWTSMNNSLKIELGYPGLMEGVTIPDKRNDNRILDIFRRDDKLIE
jgi:hypothetical protein